MNFRVDRWRTVALRSSLVILTTAGALLLSSCGGGGQSSQTRRFSPTRMIVFGDESSLLLPPSTPSGLDARKYSVNVAADSTDDATINPTIDCRFNLLWVQQLAARYGLVFAECNPAGAPVTAQMRATVGGMVADVVAAVDAFLASSAPVPTDLITMMVGTNDVLEIYNSVKSDGLLQNAAVAEIERRAELLASQVNRLVNSNNTRGRVMYSTVPDVNLTPFGVSKSSTDRTLLKLLTDSFNEKFRGKVALNGRSLGLLRTDQRFRNLIDFVRQGKSGSGSSSDVSNVTAASCLDPVDLLTCTNTTLVSGATSTNHLWAGNINFSAAGHILVGNDAIDLATSLPW